MPSCRPVSSVASLLIVVGSLPAAPAPNTADHFGKKVRPLLLAKCVSCHGPHRAKGKLRLDSAARLFAGGESGPAVVRGKPDESLLIRAIRHVGEIKMPPKGKLKDQENVIKSILA